jgi:hypothetical protein
VVPHRDAESVGRGGEDGREAVAAVHVVVCVEVGGRPAE